jgi:(p)ppGpp synthase/HD superfamily hydrolase
MNTPTFESTLEFIRTDAHEGVLDKGGMPYWQHPLRVATNVGILFPECAEDEAVLIGALLHDVLEDTPYIYADLVARGYHKRTLDICWWTDKNSRMYKGLTYIQKIQHLCADGPTEALKVKYADLTDNMNPLREWDVPPKMSERYDTAMRLIEDELSSRDFAEGSHN